MKHRSPGPSRDLLSDVLKQFERWRRRRKRGSRIPEALWRAAVEAALERGISKTAQTLGLDYYGLKKRLESTVEVSEPESMAEQGFVEIPLFASAPECVFEIEGTQGTRLRVELKGSAAAHCEALAQVLWSMTR